MTNATTRHAPGSNPIPNDGGLAAAPAAQLLAIAYFCADADDSASEALYTAWCQRRAAADGWTLTQVVTDPDNLTPLIERDGWRRVTRLLADGNAGAVITVNRQMVADTPAAWERLTCLLQGLGAVLVTSASTPASRACEAPGGTS